MREPGIYNNVPIDTYHGEEGISSSGINLILDCPKRYWYEYHGRPIEMETRAQKDARKIGSAFHMLLLEPDKFEKMYFPMEEEVNLTTKIGKEKYAEAEFQAEGREIIRAGDWVDIWAMAQEARAHPLWLHMDNSKVEQSIYWNAGFYNTRLKSRPDIYTDKLIIDVKTVRSINEFQRTIYQSGYHRQAAMQIDGLKHFNTEGDNSERFHAFFLVEKHAPYLTACFTLDLESIKQGRREYQDGMMTYSECMKAGLWPGYDSKFQITSIPQWVMKRDNI